MYSRQEVRKTGLVQKIKREEIVEILEKVSLILIGTMILGFGFYNFYYLNHITEGGVLGILLLLKNLFGIQPSMANIIIDFTLLLLGYRTFGKKFFIYSLFASYAFSMYYDLFASIGPIVPQIESGLLNAILGGTCIGVGAGIIVNTGNSSGGEDAFALMVAKKTSWSLTKIYMFMDGFILLLSISYLSESSIFYSMIASTLSGKIMDLFLNHRKKVLKLATT